MKRRDFLKSGSAVALSSAVTMEARAAAKTRQPNVLYVFSDQHRAFALPGEPFSTTLAPTFDAFRNENCSMEQCVSNYPLCTPYRAIFISGLYPQQSGVMGNETPLQPRMQPLGETFRKAGYHTGYIGKWHIHGQESVGHEDAKMIPKGPYRMGFEDWQVWANTNDHYHTYTFNQETGEKIYPEGWGPVRMTDAAVDFVRKQPKDKPWFLVMSWNPPHPPFDPPEEEATNYPIDKLKFRPNTQMLKSNEEVQKGVRSEASLRKSARGYLGSITGIDKEFARVLKVLDETGQADDTIIVYTSDHGEMLGSQGLMGKRVPYEESCRVPFIVRYPGVTKQRHKSDVLFSAVDIYPTLCGLAGVPVPQHCAGRDLSGVMRGEMVEEPEYVFLISQPEAGSGKKPPAPSNAGRSQGGNDGARVCPPYRGVRTKTHTYVMADTGRWLLFDNIADPYQMKNLVRDPSQQALMARLDGEIENWLRTVNDKFPYAKAKKAVYRFA